MTTVKNIYDYINYIAPFDAQEDWDNSGFLVGDFRKEVKKVVLTLDVTKGVTALAADIDADLIVSHHPAIFGGLTELKKGDVVFDCIENHIAVISAHTSFDIAKGGINDNLCERLGLANVQKIDGTFINVGELPCEMSIDDFAQYVSDTLNVSGLRYTDTEKSIKRVAVGGGACEEFTESAMAVADCFLTGDMKYHKMLDCAEKDFAVISAGHFETESESFHMLLEKLQAVFPDVEFIWGEQKKSNFGGELMALDGIYLYHLKNEIEAFAVGSRVEKIHQPSREELVITLRSREGARKLLLSCRADSARLHFTDYAPENPAKPPMLCMLLRKRLTGARITSLTQDGLERIVKINLDATNELGDLVKYSIIVEIMGRYSNIILTDENGVIVDALKRVDESKSQVRQIMPNERYIAPPAQDKLNIFTDDITLIKSKLSESSKKPAKAFQDIIMGVSPIICREYEDGVSVDVIKQYAENPTPIVIFNEKPFDFTFMPINQYGSLMTSKKFETFSQLLDFFFYEKVRVDRIKNRSGELFKTIQNLHERAVRKAVNRTAELEECRDKEKYKIFGDLIATNQYALQKGAPFYDLENYYDNNSLVRIPADVTISPAQNAQKYYKEYRKKQVAESKLTDFIREANEEAEYLNAVIDSLSRAETDAEITAIKTELADMGYLKHRSVKNAKNQKTLKPMEFESEEGFRIFVGRNNVMNDKLTLKTAKNYDLWFHVKDTAGSHVVIENDGREFTDKVIREAALLAAYNSTAGSSSNVPVDYTIIKNVKKPAGAKPGMVIYVDYKTEFVTPNLQEIERMKRIV